MNYDDILPLFLSQDELRPELQFVHNTGEYAVATNGHILIEIPLSKVKKKYNSVERYPNYKSVMPKESDYFKEAKLITAESIREVLQTVPMRKEMIEYVKCEGSGWNHDTASGDCEACKGKGEVEGKDMIFDLSTHKVKIGEGYFNPNYVEVLLKVAQVSNTGVILQRCTSETKANQFEIDDVKILIMPMRIRDNMDNIRRDDFTIHELEYLANEKI